MQPKVWIAAAAACSLSAVAPAQTLSLNLPSAFAPVKAKLSTGQVGSIVVIGDSLSYRPGSWLPDFRARVQAVHGDAGLGHMAYSLWSGAEYGAGWTIGQINQDLVPHRSLDGMWARSPVNGWSVYHAGAATSLTLMVAGEPGAGTITVTPAAMPGTPLVAESASPVVRSVTVTNPAGLGDVIATSTGAATFLGVSLTNGAPGAIVHRVANGGWGVNNYLQRDWTFDGELALLAPDLVYIWIGQNDQAYTSVTYQAPLNQLIDRVRAVAPGAGIVLVGTYDSGAAAIPGLVQAMQSVAASRSLGFLNLHAAGGTYSYLFSHEMLDGVHFTPAGGAHFGRIMSDAFETDGTTICTTLFTVHPAPATTMPGQHTGFSVVVGTGGTAIFQWRHDGVPLTDNGRISGATSPNLTIADVQPGDAGVYDVVASGVCDQAVSAPATLTVNLFCPSDFNRDGYVTGEDFDLFVAAFELGDPSSDFDANTFVNGDDFDGFVEAFVAGC